jgi:hypothetical protein
MPVSFAMAMKALPKNQRVQNSAKYKGLIPRALLLGEMRIISPVSFELRLLE